MNFMASSKRSFLKRNYQFQHTKNIKSKRSVLISKGNIKNSRKWSYKNIGNFNHFQKDSAYKKKKKTSDHYSKIDKSHCL